MATVAVYGKRWNYGKVGKVMEKCGCHRWHLDNLWDLSHSNPPTHYSTIARQNRRFEV